MRKWGLALSLAVGCVFASSGASAATYLGRACATDAECGTGLSCIKADSTAFDGEGPAKGYCTLDCSGDAGTCGAIDPTAVCVEFASKSYCFEGCTFGPTNLQQFDPQKCHGRQEVACRPFYDTAGNFTTSACFPQCNADSDCGTGLHCDPRTGTCSTTAASGKSLGEPCTQPSDGGTDSCAGTCIGFVHSSGTTPFTYMCAENCTNGALPSCGWAGPGTGPASAYCLFSTTTVIDNGGPGFGDLGSCGQLCDCNSDCKDPDLVCLGWTGTNAAQLEATFGRKGYCSDPLQDDGGTAPGLCGPTSDSGVGGSPGGGGSGGVNPGGGFGGGKGGSGATGAGGTNPGFGGSGFGGSVQPDGGSFANGGGSSSNCGCRAVGATDRSAGELASALLALGLGLTLRRARRAK